MNRILTLTFVALLVYMSSLQADAAVAQFRGVINNGGGGTAVLGTLPPGSRTFDLIVNYTEGAGFTPFLGTPTSGSFVVASPTTTFSVTGGSIVVTEGGVNDTVLFAVNVAGPSTGQLIFTFTRNAITNNNANNANIFSLVDGNTTSFTADFSSSGAGAYTGNITGVPEPSTALALVGLVAGGGIAQWRRKRRQKKVAAE